MLPFHIQFKTGMPVYEQVVFAVKKAIVSGQLKPGDRFPSVRQMSQELKINPNTGHKIVAALIQENLLEVMPGIGTLVSKNVPSSREQKKELLGEPLEQLVVEAKKLSLSLEDVEEALRNHWKKYSKE